MLISNFLAEQLAKVAKDEGFLEYGIEQEPGSKHGDGFVATMVAITLNGKRKIGDKVTESQLDLMCKLLPENVDRREAFESSSIFEQEIHIYNKVLSNFEKFQNEKNISIQDRFTEYPKCYAAASDVNDEHVLIMENLKSKGFGLWDKTKSIDYDTVCLYMKALGKLHALSFAIRDQKPQLFEEISDFEDCVVKIMKKENNPFVAMFNTTYEKVLSVLDQPVELKVMKNAKENCVEEILRLTNKKIAGKFYVITHGDSWNNNMFYSHEGSSKPKKICLLDWQISKCASPAMDISYYLMSSTNKSIRERIDELLAVYFNSLSDFMGKLGSDVNKWFTFDDLIDQLKTVGMYGVLMAPLLLQIMVSDPKNIFDMDGISKEKPELTDLAILDEFTTKEFKQRLSDVIQDGIRMGWVQL